MPRKSKAIISPFYRAFCYDCPFTRDKGASSVLAMREVTLHHMKHPLHRIAWQEVKNIIVTEPPPPLPDPDKPPY